MNRLAQISGGLIAFAVMALGASSAQAKNIANSGVDLKVKELPQRELSSLQMRTGQVRTAAAEEAPAASVSKSKSASPKANSALNYKAIPTQYRDIKERVIFKTNIGYGLDSTRLSGNVGQGGFAPGEVVDNQGNAFDENRNYLLGDAIVGTRGVGMRSLNSFFLSRFSFDDGGGAFSASSHVYDAGESQNLLIRAAYAEVDGLGSGDGGVLDAIYIRAGRQYKYGSSRYMANFDGLTMAYNHRKAEVSAFVGQRVSSFFDDDPGLMLGAGIKLRGDEIINYPVDFNVDFLSYDDGIEENPARLYIEANSRARVTDNTRLYFRGRFIDDGTDGDNAAGIGRLGGQVRQHFGEDLIVIVDVEKNFAREVAFDFIGTSPIDVINVGDQIGLAIGEPQNSTLIGTRANYQINSTLEAFGFYRNRLVKNQEVADAFTRPFQEVGLAMAALFDSRLTATGQYKFRVHELEAASNLAGSGFDDTGGSGTKKMHELSGEARYNFGKKKAHAAVGAFVRIFDIETPYAFLDNDGRGGGRVDVGYWPTDIFRVRAIGELTQPSQVIEADLDVLLSLRLFMEATF